MALAHGAEPNAAGAWRQPGTASAELRSSGTRADNPDAVAYALIIVVTVALIAGSIVVFSRARGAARTDGAEDLVSRADTQRYLAENWALVESSAREGGMSDEEIAQVRANVLGGS